MIATGPIDALRPAVEPVAIPPGPRSWDPGRRVRIEPTVDPELRQWLRRAARCHAHITHTVRLFGQPSKAGGDGLLGAGYAERVARGDRTVLFDCMSFCVDEMSELRDEIQKRMDSAPPTDHAPGTPGKVETMAERLFRGDSLFIKGDRPINVE